MYLRRFACALALSSVFVSGAQAQGPNSAEPTDLGTASSATLPPAKGRALPSPTGTAETVDEPDETAPAPLGGSPAAVPTTSELRPLDVQRARDGAAVPGDAYPKRTRLATNSLNYLRDGVLTSTVDYSENLRMRLSLGSTFYGYDNADFRKRSVETIEDELRYSDDRSFFVETQLSAGLAYAVHPDVRIEIGFRHRGLWGKRGQAAAGSDSLSQQFMGYLGAFDQLDIAYTPKLPKPFELQVIFGRHNFYIGGAPREYILGDTLDGVSVRLGAGRFGAIRGLVDLFTASTLADQSLRELQLDTSQPDRFFRGQINTVRYGALYENVDGIVKGLGLRAYYLQANIGASDVQGTGADVSYNGALGNFADNDYTYTYGGRVNYDWKILETRLQNLTLSAMGEGGVSGGVDRKEAVARDVETEGNAYGATLALHHNYGQTSWMVNGAFYHFDGADYASDGLRFKSGFVSMNAQAVGGVAAARVLGWRPSAAVDASGVRYSPHDRTRYAGTQFLNLGAAMAYKGLRVWGQYWGYTDTSHTFLDFGSLDQLDPPFGYSRTEFAAERRLGKKLANEFELGLEHLLNDHMKVNLVGGLLVPEKFYRERIGQVAGEQIGGQKTFWIISAGVTAWL